MVFVGVLETLRRLESLQPSWDGSNRDTATRERRVRVESSEGAARSPESHRTDVANGVVSDVASDVASCVATPVAMGVATGVATEESSGVAASVVASMVSKIVAGLVDGAASGEAAVAPVLSLVAVASATFDAPSSTVRICSSRTLDWG